MGLSKAGCARLAGERYNAKGRGCEGAQGAEGAEGAKRGDTRCTLSTPCTLCTLLSQLLRLSEVQREVEPCALFEFGGDL